jgi:hypothetical protein
MPAHREVHARGWRVRLDLSQQVLELQAYPCDPPRLSEDGPADAPLVTPPTHRGPVSAGILLLKAKQFDDGLCAAVELAAQRGVGRFAGKAALLRSLAENLPSPFVHAACALGGMNVDAPPGLRELARALADEFLREESASKPLGFFTWTPELSAIFRQDRFLQQPLEVMAHAAGSQEAYRACLRLNARFTNPPAGQRAFLPASRSHEQVLVERLYGTRPIPDGFDLITELINRVRSGEICLEPTTESGWYDYQTWSLEPLVVPERMEEAPRLQLDKRYRRHLEGLFRAALALTRETRVNQIKFATAGCLGGPPQPPIIVCPSLSVEPLPSLFARRAASYRFVRSVLEEAFGPDALAGLHRLTQEGPCVPTLADELVDMEKLFAGAEAIARRELGMETIDDEAIRRFTEWKANLTSDSDVGRDCRMMVPVFHDVGRRKTKVWAFLGWQIQMAFAKYIKQPTVLGVDWAGVPEQRPAGTPEVEFSDEFTNFACPVMAEVYVSRLMDRDEFRRHCDQHRTSEAILAALD